MKILSAIDDGAASFNAFKSAYKLARRIGYGISAIHVDMGQEYSTEFIVSGRMQDKLRKELHNISRDVITKIKDAVKETDVYLSGGVPSEEIINFVKENGVYKIVSMGHSTKTIVAQSVTKTVLNSLSIPILVTNKEIEFNNILLHIQNSKAAEKIVKTLIPFIVSLKPLKVTVIMVLHDSKEMLNGYKNIAEIPYFSDPPDLKRDIAIYEANQRKALDEVIAILKESGISAFALIQYGDTLETIKREAANHDLLILDRANPYLSDHSLSILFI
jgi:nucleotide-binding universal stress UspA family protein